MESSFFRFVNEQLYSTNSTDIELSTSKMELYHQGYAAQCKLWKEDPLFIIYKWLNKLFKGKQVVIVDIGAGEGILSKTLYHYGRLITELKCENSGKHFPIKPQFSAKIHAFDLYPINEFVQQSNAACLPLVNNCSHASVFCLSLMGTDYSKFLLEANRIVKMNGFIIIGEVQSRLVECKPAFIKACCALGWNLVKQLDESHFCIFLFQKKFTGKDIGFPKLLPCLYKKR